MPVLTRKLYRTLLSTARIHAFSLLAPNVSSAVPLIPTPLADHDYRCDKQLASRKLWAKLEAGRLPKRSISARRFKEGYAVDEILSLPHQVLLQEGHDMVEGLCNFLILHSLRVEPMSKVLHSH
jgi:hypothetical protein